jgi:uncharacterized protein (DUF1501 family)
MKSSALAMFGVGAAPSWLSRAVYAKDAPSERKKILVAIFQRGAVDGLNMVVPYGDPDYYAARPSIAIPKPGNAEGCALDLDGHFALHPSLLSLKPLWERRELAIIQAVGSPDPTRSHFDAQDYMESGTPGLQSTGDGWLNRALVKEARPSPVRAVSLGSNLPKCLRGTNDALAIQSIEDFQVKDPRAAAAFERMYSESVDAELNGTARETFEAVRMMQSLAKSKSAPANGAQYPKGRLGKGLQQIARVIKANVGLEVAFTDVGGWDTHVNEVGARPHEGQLANLLREFGEGLAAFSQDLDDRMSDVTVVTMSEFGRTVRENGDRGTDHGHANVMLLLGGSVNGGKRYGQWPGLAREQLYEGRDLQITTDFRSVLAELVTRQLGNRDLATVFPGFRGAAAKGLLA